MSKEVNEANSKCCGAYCSEVCECAGSIAWYAALQAKAREGMNGEVKLLARMETNAERSAYLEEVVKARGKPSAMELRTKVWAYMQANKA